MEEKYKICPICHSPVANEDGSPFTDEQLNEFKELGIYIWTDDPILTTPPLAPGYPGDTPRRMMHIKELQDARKQQEIDIGIAEEDRTEFMDINLNSPPSKIYVEQLRESTEKILDALGIDKETYFNYDWQGNEVNTEHQLDWTDPVIREDRIPMRAIQIEELRRQITVNPVWMHIDISKGQTYGSLTKFVPVYTYDEGRVGCKNVYGTGTCCIQKCIGFTEYCCAPINWEELTYWERLEYILNGPHCLEYNIYGTGGAVCYYGPLDKWFDSKITNNMLAHKYNPDVNFHFRLDFHAYLEKNISKESFVVKEYKIDPVFINKTPFYSISHYPFVGAIRIPSCGFIEDNLEDSIHSYEIPKSLDVRPQNEDIKDKIFETLWENPIEPVVVSSNVQEDRWEFRSIDWQDDWDCVVSELKFQYFYHDKIIDQGNSFKYSAFIPEFWNLENLNLYRKTSILHVSTIFENARDLNLYDRDGNIWLLNFKYMLTPVYSVGNNPYFEFQVEFWPDCLLCKDNGIEFVAKEWINITKDTTGEGTLSIGSTDVINRSVELTIEGEKWIRIKTEEGDNISNYDNTSKVFYIQYDQIQFGDDVHGKRPEAGLEAHIFGFAKEIGVAQYYASGYVELSEGVPIDWDNPLELYVKVNYYNIPNVFVRNRGWADVSYWSIPSTPETDNFFVHEYYYEEYNAWDCEGIIWPDPCRFIPPNHISCSKNIYLDEVPDMPSDTHFTIKGQRYTI